ncbi:MAG: PIN domain-containing protein [Chlorobi bacterium]|nr:PIN domain-containing protein [Chlorobiota bacterium]
METVVICDANIFIDLEKSELIPLFFDLPIEIYTTDLVWHEVKSAQEVLKVFRQNGKLKILSASEEELQEMVALKTRNLSLADCSVLYYAKTRGYLLLTNEKKSSKNGRYSQCKIPRALICLRFIPENRPS